MCSYSEVKLKSKVIIWEKSFFDNCLDSRGTGESMQYTVV